MPGIVVRGKALKIVNKGGGRVTKTVVNKVVNPVTNKEERSHQHMVSRERVPGSDYVVFNCPSCGQRNKRCLYEMKGRAGMSLSFKCHRCYNEVEVAPPDKPNTIIMGTADPMIQRSPLVGPDGRALG
jgi:DNA-directed RNA polymerase subunit M/transcription elongation factor TFIIS